MQTRHIIALSLFSMLIACSSENNQSSGPTVANETNNGDTVGNGLVEQDGPGLAGQFLLGPEDYDLHLSKIGAAPSLVHIFIDWFDEEQLISAQTDSAPPFSPRPIDLNDFLILNFAFEPGTVIAISWALPLPNFDVTGNYYENIPNVQDIIDGTYDDYIRQFAQAIDVIENPVMLTLFGEFDNNAFHSFGPNGRNSALADPEVLPALDVPVAQELRANYGDPDHPDGPERVRDAFRHVIDIFTEEGVTEPQWYMYASSGFLSAIADPGEQQLVDATSEWNQPQWYYAGDEYIDWVGKSLHHSDLASLQNKFENAYTAWGEVTNKPFFSPEYSIGIDTAQSSRAQQIEQEFSTYFSNFPRFRAFAMVDQDPSSSDDTFGISTLGGLSGEFPDELEAWQSSVVDNENWAVIALE